MIKRFSTLLLFIAVTCVMATNSVSLAQNSGSSSNLYKSGKYMCWGVMVSGKDVCNVLILDVAETLGCKSGRGHLYRQRLHAQKCSIKRVKGQSAFAAIVANYYNTTTTSADIAATGANTTTDTADTGTNTTNTNTITTTNNKTKVTKLSDAPAWKYSLGSFNCFEIRLSGNDECKRLIFDVARHLECPQNIARSCIIMRSGIPSHDSRNQFGKVIKDFYDKTRNIIIKNGKIVADGKMTELGVPLDGHHRSKGYSNIYKSRSVCPTSNQIEISINIDDGKRRWTPKEIDRIVAYPYELIRIEGDGANRCLRNPIQFVVKLDGNKVYSEKYDLNRENKRVFMGKMAQSVMAEILAIYSPESSVAEVLPNPYRDIGKLERDYSKSSMVSVYDGKFDKITYPVDGKRNQQLAVLVFSFFDGVKRQSTSKKCYPTGSVKFPWIQIHEKKDSFGNVTNRSKTKLIALIAPEAKPLYQKYSTSLNASNASAYWGAIHLIKAFGCDSPEYQSMFKQILRLSSGVLNGFDSAQPTNGLVISRDQRIKFVLTCLSSEYELTARAYQQCVCDSQISEKYFKDADKYISSGHPRTGDGYFNAKDYGAYNLEFGRECRGRVGNHRPEISRLIKDLVSDIK